MPLGRKAALSHVIYGHIVVSAEVGSTSNNYFSATILLGALLDAQVSISGQALVFVVRTSAYSLFSRAGLYTYIAFFGAQARSAPPSSTEAAKAFRLIQSSVAHVPWDVNAGCQFDCYLYNAACDQCMSMNTALV